MKKHLLFSVLGLLINTLAMSQLYVSASTGIMREKVGDQLSAGWNFNKHWQAGVDVTSLLVQPPTWIGAQGGPIIRLDDKDEHYTYISPYLGAYYKKVGRTHSNDRYVEGGNITFLSKDLETDQFNYGVGIMLSRRAFYAKLGSFFNRRESAYALTIGLTHLFE